MLMLHIKRVGETITSPSVTQSVINKTINIHFRNIFHEVLFIPTYALVFKLH